MFSEKKNNPSRIRRFVYSIVKYLRNSRTFRSSLMQCTTAVVPLVYSAIAVLPTWLKISDLIT